MAMKLGFIILNRNKITVIAKYTLSEKKVLYAIFFSGEVVQYRCQWKGKKRYCKILQRCGIEEIEKILSEMAPSHGFQTCLTCTWWCPRAHMLPLLQFFFLQKEKVTILPHPPYSPNGAPCEFFLFSKSKTFLAGQRYQSKQALGSASRYTSTLLVYLNQCTMMHSKVDSLTEIMHL